MGHDAFRDPSAALERAAALAEENERLRAENAALRAELAQLRAQEDKKTLRVIDERDALAAKLEKMRLSHWAAIARIRDDLSKPGSSEVARKLADVRVENYFLQTKLEACEEQLRALEEKR